MPWEGVGTDRKNSQQDQQKKTDMVWSRGLEWKTRDYQQKPYIVTWIGEGAEEDKRRLAAKDTDLRMAQDTIRSRGRGRHLVKNLIVGEHLTEEKRKR